MTNKQSNPAPNEPWREGRPSFKAFYPEIFLLTLVTIAFVAIAVKLSCATLRNAKGSDSDRPVAVGLDEPFLAPFAFARDVSLDEAEEQAATADEEAAPDASSDSEVADESATSPESSASSESSEPLESNVAPKTSSEPVARGASPWRKIAWIWVICLIVPVVLWIWRGAVWIGAVWGVYYELRVDADNPRATTFLTTRGIFNKRTDSLHIGSIKDIQSHQSFFQKYFMGGVGTIILFTNDLTDGKVEMKNMAEPSRIFNALDSLRRNYWSRGGMQLRAGSEGDEDGSFNEEYSG